MRRNWIISLIIGSVTLLYFLFWQPASINLIDWYLAFQCRRSWGVEFVHSGIVKEGNRWIVYAPALARGEKIAGTAVDAAAKRLEFSYSFRPFSFELGIQVKLVEPSIVVHESQIDWNALTIEPTRLGALIHLSPQIQIDHGQIVFVRDGKSTKPLHFDFDLDLMRGRRGGLVAYLDPDDMAHNSLHIEIKRVGKKAYNALVDIQELDLATLVQAGKTLMPHWLNWHIESGVIDGTVEVDFLRGQKPHYNGSIGCSDLKFSHHLAEASGHFPKLNFSYKENGKSWYCEIPDKGTFAFLRNNESFWSFESIEGGIDWTPNTSTAMTLNAICIHDNAVEKLVVEGGGFFEDEHQEAVSLAFHMLPFQEMDEDQMSTSMRLFYRHLGEQHQCLELDICNLKPHVFALLKHFLGFYKPHLTAFDVDAGSIDGGFVAFIEQGKLTDVKFENFEARDVYSTLFPIETAFHADYITGNLAFRADNSNIFHTVDADLKIEEGSVCFLGLQEWRIEDIVTSIEVINGVIQPSTFSASLGDLKGLITVDGTSYDRILTGRFEGPMKGVAALGSHAFEEGIGAKFADDDLILAINLARFDRGLQLEGSALVQNVETIQFGCFLIKEQEEEWASYRYGSAFEEEGGYHFSLWNQQLRLAGFAVVDGWFNAVDLPLEKYVSPFFLDNKKFKLAGSGDFQGAFNQGHISVKYSATDLSLESDHFVIHIPELAAESWAVQEYSLLDGAYKGVIPVQNGEFFDKNSGLLFTGIQTAIFLENSGIDIKDIEVFCNGIYFEGDIAVDPDYAFEIDIEAMSGHLSQLRQLLTHFNDTKFLDHLPIEGHVCHRPLGGFISYDQAAGWQVKVSWALTDANLEIQSKNLKLEELQANIDFDLKEKTLELSDLQGTLIVGKPNHAEEYILAADHIHFSDFTQNEGSFDLWIGDRQRDVMRLVGTSSQQNSEYITLLLDEEKSHFGNVHPNHFSMQMQDWFIPTKFHIELDFELKTLFYDLQKLGRTKLVPLSHHLLDRFEEWKSGRGEFTLTLDYDRMQSIFTYSMTGNEIAVDDLEIKEIKLNGRSQNQQWSIDELKVDDWSLTAGVTPREDGLDIHYLGASYGDIMLVGLEGGYTFNNKFFDGEVKVLELDLAHLEQFPRLKERLEHLDLKGKIKASGKVTIEGDKKNPCVDALLEVEMKNWGLNGISFSDVEDVSCHFRSNRGITVRRLDTHFSGAHLNLERFDYNFFSDEIVFEALNFKIPAQQLPEVVRVLDPYICNAQIKRTLKEIKTDGIFAGSLDIEITHPHCALKAKLDDGVYQFLNQKYDLKNFSFDYDPCEFHLTANYQWDNQLFLLYMSSKSPNLEHGEMSIDLVENRQESPLTIHWRWDDNFYFERVFGLLPGIEFDLVRDAAREPDKLGFYLEGEIHMDGNAISPLVSHEINTALREWNVGSGYSLKGKWIIQPPTSTGQANLYYFHGDFTGNDFFCKGYQFDHMNAKIDIAPSYITLRSLEVTDSCGVVYADRIELYLDPLGSWQLSLPLLKVNEFQPSLLRELGVVSAPVKKPLNIKTITLENLRGKLADPHSIMGAGVLHFSNPTRKNHGNNILAIPVEIIRRIGLDTNILTPVRGTIEYEIKDNRIYLKQFKDVVSEGKLSRFFLADNDGLSYLDFKGNLNVHVRMKQNNLVFKLTELFIVNIKGTLLDPIYTMHKQSKNP